MGTYQELKEYLDEAAPAIISAIGASLTSRGYTIKPIVSSSPESLLLEIKKDEFRFTLDLLSPLLEIAAKDISSPGLEFDDDLRDRTKEVQKYTKCLIKVTEIVDILYNSDLNIEEAMAKLKDRGYGNVNIGVINKDEIDEYIENNEDDEDDEDDEDVKDQND